MGPTTWGATTGGQEGPQEEDPEREKAAWPRGHARSRGEIAFDRATLVKGMPLAQFEGAFQKHDIGCELAGETAAHKVKLQIQPKVTISQGKAVKATLNWGKIAPPRLAKTALWCAMAADNASGGRCSISSVCCPQ